MKKTKIIAINLDKERHIKFDLNAFEIIENLTGKSVAEIGQDMKMSTLKVLLYAGLKWEDKDLTAEYVGTLVTLDNLQEVSEKLGDCFGSVK